MLTAIVSGVLSTWCISTLLYAWKGFERLRRWAGVYGPYEVLTDDTTGEERLVPITIYGRLLECYWCLSVVVGLLITPIILLEWRITIPFALAGGSMLLSKGGRTVWRMQEDG